MTTFVELAETQNAIEFKQKMETSLAEKVSEALEARKPTVATAMFEEKKHEADCKCKACCDKKKEVK